MDTTLVIGFLVIISALYSYINARFLKLPGTIGVVTIAISISVFTLVLDSVNPAAARYLSSLAKSIDFSRTVLNVMLGFLLFASSFNLDVKSLRRETRPVLILSTVGVILSAFLFGGLFYGAALLFHFNLPLEYCLLFGALISPTDPVAVSAIIRGSNLPPNLETIISGESLFNDGIGLVLFTTLLELIESHSSHVYFMKSALLFGQEVFGGIGVGLLLGYLANRLMRSITDFQTIVLISLALVMSVTVVATAFHLSIPLAVVSAGIFTGSRTINTVEKERSHQLLEQLWKLIDALLNTILFVMIGLQVVALPFLNNFWLAGGTAIVIVLLARWISISLPLVFLRRTLQVSYSNVTILTWAGVRGAVSIALALSLPRSPYREVVLASSYFIVIFSIIVQGLSLNKLINHFFAQKDLFHNK